MIAQADGPASSSRPSNQNYLKGSVFGLVAASIWAGWSVITRLAVTSSLNAWDIPALRFGVAGLLLLPIVVLRGLALDRLGWCGLAGLIAGTGAPYALIFALGLRFAPAYDARALNPGCMPLFVAAIAATVLRERPSPAQKLGLSLILGGALVIVCWHGATWTFARSLGDGLFLVASFLTAIYTVIMRRSKLDPLHVAALVSTGSLIVYAPVYVIGGGFDVARVPLASLAIQVAYQGIAVTIVSLVLYGRTVLILGASGASAFGAFVPALLGIPLLGEWPTAPGWVGITLISGIMYQRAPQDDRRCPVDFIPYAVCQIQN
jgi:drug/metabolite transporter (DMT)-like permease